jgi:hypothetical protein
MQTQQFNIEIKNEKIKAYKTITLLIIILYTLFFIYLSLNNIQRKSASISIGFIVLYAGYRFYISSKNNHDFYFDEWAFFLLMILWVDNYLIALVSMIFFLLYTVTLQKIIYHFDTSRIIQKNFPWKKYNWDQLSNVILKDNLLTIDFKNNKLMQAEIASTDIDQSLFNAFAREQLNNTLKSEK